MDTINAHMLSYTNTWISIQDPKFNSTNDDNRKKYASLSQIVGRILISTKNKPDKSKKWKVMGDRGLFIR